MPVPQAIERCREVLQRVAGDRRSSAAARQELARLSAMALDLDTARAMCVETRRTLVELGWEMRAALVSFASGPIELEADAPERSEAELRMDYDALVRMKERNFVELTAALLAEAVYRQRRYDEARTLVDFSRDTAAPDDLAVHIVWRCVAGKLAARAGDTRAGLELVNQAVQMIEATDDPSGQAEALVDLAEVRWLAGRPAEADLAVHAAIERYGRKGNLARARRARHIAALLTAGRDPLGS
jgi:hypothetical protein